MPRNALAPETSVVNELYKTLVPVNARTLIDTMRGETAPITEANFSKDELDVLKKMYETRKAANEASRQQLANEIAISRKDYEKNPQKGFFVYEDGKFGGESRNMSYDEFIRRKTKELESFDKTRQKTSLSYYDYPGGGAAPTFDSWLSSVWKSYTDPAYRMKTVLGSFNVMDTPEGKKVVDQYNFDKLSFYKQAYNLDPTKASISELWRKSNGPVDFLDMLMIKKYPGANRPVSIKLD